MLKITAVFFSLWFGTSIWASAALAQNHHPVSEALCLDPIRYVQCFQFTKEECLREADLAVFSCIDRLPERPSEPTDQGQWGLALGYCSEETFALWNKRRLVKSDWCGNLLKEAESSHNQSRYQWERGALKPRTRDQQLWELVQIVSPPLGLGLLLPLGAFYAAFSIFAKRGVRDQRLVWTRNLLYPLFLAGALLGEVAGHLWNPDVYLSINSDPWQVGGILIALGVSPVYFVLVWLLHRGLRSELRASRSDL